MILVCDAYRKDLQHPNEYIRGSTLRFLCKLKEPELIEPLMSSIRACLEHRHSYVRRNAVLAIFKIYINFEKLIPDAPEIILDFLQTETNASCKRNAFLMLVHLDQDKALAYLDTCLDQISSFNEILQLVIVELIYKVCIGNPSERAKFIRAIYNLLSTATSASVRYEAAATLITLSQAPTAIRSAANCFIDICLKESDNNVKLIILDRLIALKETVQVAERVLQEVLMDILRILHVASDLEVKEKILALSLDLVSSKNAEEMVHLLKKEVNKTQNEGLGDESAKYRRVLVDTIYHICMKYPDILLSDQLVSTLFELLSSDDEATAQIIITFARAFIIKYPEHKKLLLNKILEEFPLVRNCKVHRGLVWLLGEFAESTDTATILQAVSVIRKCIGELPIVDSELRKENENNPEQSNAADDSQTASATPKASTANKLVTADGTYATQSALTNYSSQDKNNMPAIRAHLFEGNYYIGSALGSCFIKLAYKFKESKQRNARTLNSFVAECMFILTSIVRFGKCKVPLAGQEIKPINDDDYERVCSCVLVLSKLNADAADELTQVLEHIHLHEMRHSVESMLSFTENEKKEQKEKSKRSQQIVQIDDHINFSQLLSKNQEQLENQFELSLSKAIGSEHSSTATSSIYGRVSGVDDLMSVSKLSKVTQLTGFSDPIYSECYVNVNQYDICLDVLIVNQTADTLQNCMLELSTLGDLKLVERPQAIVLAPHDFANIKATVKVASTENGIIFGNIVYDVSGSASDHNVVVLNDIHINIMDYIMPSSCSDAKFAEMWSAFEWENKVTVNTKIANLQDYLSYLIKATNMKCLTPQKSLSGDCCFLAANLYARSIFGEDALANVSIEKSSSDSQITGHVRIRAKSQGMALSLGDKINQFQKVAKAG